jgi:hypothetical protein
MIKLPVRGSVRSASDPQLYTEHGMCCGECCCVLVAAGGQLSQLGEHGLFERMSEIVMQYDRGDHPAIEPRAVPLYIAICHKCAASPMPV